MYTYSGLSHGLWCFFSVSLKRQASVDVMTHSSYFTFVFHGPSPWWRLTHVNGPLSVFTSVLTTLLYLYLFFIVHFSCFYAFSLSQASYFHSCVFSPACVHVCVCVLVQGSAIPLPSHVWMEHVRVAEKRRERETGSYCAWMSSPPLFLPRSHPLSHWNSIVCALHLTLPTIFWKIRTARFISPVLDHPHGLLPSKQSHNTKPLNRAPLISCHNRWSSAVWFVAISQIVQSST